MALLRAWNGDFDEDFVQARLHEVRELLSHDELNSHTGVHVVEGATSDAYRQWADSYDQPGNELLELDLATIDSVLDTLPNGAAADTACGTGRLTRRLAERGHRVVGVDRSESMVQRARHTTAGVPFVVGDMNALPLPDCSVDLLTNALALTHAPDLDAVMSEFARVLRPGGVAIVSDVHPELVFLGSAVKGQDTRGHPELAACHRRTVGDYLRAVLRAGFRVRGFTEQWAKRDGSMEPSPESMRVIGAWREWPWTLLEWAPEASRAAWEIPALFIWHLELE